jgi:hypothetical protein
MPFTDTIKDMGIKSVVIKHIKAMKGMTTESTK